MGRGTGNAVGLRSKVEQRGEVRELGAHAHPRKMEKKSATVARGVVRRCVCGWRWRLRWQSPMGVIRPDEA